MSTVSHAINLNVFRFIVAFSLIWPFVNSIPSSIVASRDFLKISHWSLSGILGMCLRSGYLSRKEFLPPKNQHDLKIWSSKIRIFPPNFKLNTCLSPYPSVLDFWKINLEKSNLTNWIFSLFRTGFSVYFELDFYCLCSLQKSISKLIFAG